MRRGRSHQSDARDGRPNPTRSTLLQQQSWLAAALGAVAAQEDVDGRPVDVATTVDVQLDWLSERLGEEREQGSPDSPPKPTPLSPRDRAATEALSRSPRHSREGGDEPLATPPRRPSSEEEEPEEPDTPKSGSMYRI